MNKTKQFWTLVKFQFSLNPALWFLPLIIGVTSLIPFMINRDATYHSSLSFYFYTNQNFFFVGIFGSMILAPEKFQFNRMKATAVYSGTEFLLTRAIDRPVLYRAKTFLLYSLILLLPICAVIYFLRTPDLIVQESSKPLTQQVLDHVPGCVLSAVPSAHGLQPNIIIPRGDVLIAEWQVWVFILAIIVLQLLISVLSPYKFGKTLFWALCYIGLLGPAFLPLYQLGKTLQDMPSPPERLFYFFVEHQPAIWIGTTLAVIGCQIFCERYFARQEH
jgi:hypothetical protein